MTKTQKSGKHATQLAHSGRDPAGFHGFVNAPLYRGSTVLYPSYDSLLADDQDYSYGRLGTPTVPVRVISNGFSSASLLPKMM